MGPAFEPLATCSVLHLSVKVIFLVAITLAKRVGELCALMSGPPYTISFKDMAYLHPHPRFNPVVVFSFHINQPICLPAFFLKPHLNRVGGAFTDIGRLKSCGILSAQDQAFP